MLIFIYLFLEILFIMIVIKLIKNVIISENIFFVVVNNLYINLINIEKLKVEVEIVIVIFWINL